METKNKCWYFQWAGGGYNSILAPNKRSALAGAIEMGKPGGGMTVTLKPIPSSFTTNPKKQDQMASRWFMD
jgi:hypothetical protein